jgi:four helix bundle protein
MKSHTSLIAWERAHSVTIAVIRASKQHWKPWAAAVFSQLQRASLSVQLNLAEGYARHRRATFCHHLGIAYGSAVETSDLLRVCLEERLIPAETALSALRDCGESQALILGLLKRLKA